MKPMKKFSIRAVVVPYSQVQVPQQSMAHSYWLRWKGELTLRQVSIGLNSQARWGTFIHTYRLKFSGRKQRFLSNPAHSWTPTMPKIKKTKKQRRRTFPSMGSVSKSSVTRMRIPEAKKEWPLNFLIPHIQAKLSPPCPF